MIAHQILDGMACRETSYIRRTYPGFCVSPEDLQQQAWVVLLELAERYDPDRGIHFAAYATGYLRSALIRYAWQVEHVVNVTTYATRVAQVATTRATYTTTALTTAPSADPSPAAQAEGAQIARVLVRAIDRAIIGTAHGAAAVTVIAGQDVPRAVAADESASVHSIYRAVATTRRRLREDRALRRLYREVTA